MRIASGIVLSLGIILILGFLMTRLTKLLKLPSVIAYLVVGIIIGPCVINLIPGEFISRSSFISNVALTFVAFTAGEFFKFDVIKKSIGKAILITVIESIVTFALVFVLCFFAFRLEAPFSLVLASLASATAPTSTIMTIKQTGSKGHYVTTLLEVLALDGVIALFLYTISISIFVGVSSGGTLGFADIAWPLLKMFICLVIGVIFGFILKFLISAKRTTDNRLIVVVAVLLLFCGVCSLFGQSPLLGSIAIGTIYTNMCKSKDEEKVFAQVNYFMPPIMLVFFVRSGMSLDFSIFTQTSYIVIVLAFLVVRFAGKYGGAFLGGVVTAQPKETRTFLGFGLIPQASLDEFATRLEGSTDFNADLNKLIRETIVKHKRIIFNGDGYSKSWEVEAERRGLLNLKTTADALPCFVKEENRRLFEKYGVFTEAEIFSRYNILLESYATTVDIEALTVIDMVKRNVIPAAEAYQKELCDLINEKGAILGAESTETDKKILEKVSDLTTALVGLLGDLEKKVAYSKGLTGLPQATYCKEDVLPA